MVLLTAKYLQTLKSRVVDSGESKNWLGKDILEIGSEIYGLINNGVNNFPVVSTLTGLTEPILEPMGISAYNETLNIPLLNSEITNLQSKVGGIQSQAQSTINQFADKFGLNYLQDKITELEGLIAEAGENASNTIKNQLYRLRSFVKKFMGISSSSQSIPIVNYGSFGAIELIIPTATPKLGDVVGVINKLANWFLSMFSIPNQILEVLTHTVTSVVCKAIGSAGAEVSRYLSAGLLQSLPQLVPKIGSATGTLFGGAWAVLMGYAPWIDE
ncbi:hypothetical protein L2E71_22035 [Planktothrix agardhii 1032]|uniref:hypothetical protein n=1 Tax=Planktothrix agardhii TaxID=1160 RepID=UPI001F2B0332|nr:hypothetical protein [Planktothrix agardhii]MCF3600748.1 hypothetical protein [Planktothrix agardhii 1032]